MALATRLEQLGTEPIVRLPQDETGHGFDLEWKELKNQEAWKGFLEGHRDLRARVATVLLGQPLSTQAGVGGSGSYALGRVHAQVRQDVIESYVGVLGTLREHASRWLTWVNDEPDPARAEDLAPAPVWDAAIPTDTNAVALGQRARAEAVAAWRAAGVDVDAEAEARACGMTVPGWTDAGSATTASVPPSASSSPCGSWQFTHLPAAPASVRGGGVDPGQTVPGSLPCEEPR